MKKFEYLILDLDDLDKRFPKIEDLISTEDYIKTISSGIVIDKDFILNLKLNKLGEEGWELTSVTINFLNEVSKNTKFYFKREKPS